MKNLCLTVLFILLTTCAWAADTKITGFTADTSPTTDDLLPTVDDPGGTPTNKKVTIANFFKAGNITVTGTNVGIGSVTPGQILDVQGTVRTTGLTLTTGGAAGSILKSDSVGVASWAQNIETTGITIDGGGSTITTGFQGCREMQAAGTLVSWTMVSVDAGSPTSGSITLDLWKDTYANWPPTVADTITASAKPALSSATKNQDSTLTGWTTSVSAGDFICVNVDSVTSLKKVAFFLKMKRS